MQDHAAATLLVDRKGVIRMASTRAARLLEARPDALEGMRLDEVIASPDRAAIEAALATAEAGRCAIVATLPRRAGGAAERVDLEFREAGISAADPAALFHVVILTPGDARIRDVAQGAPTAICRRGVILEANDGFGDLVGLHPVALRGWDLRTLIDARDLLPAVAALRACEAGLVTRADVRFRLAAPRGGAPRPVWAHIDGDERADGPALRITFLDITPQARVLEGAARAVARLEAALDASHEAILVVGSAGDGWPVRYASEGFGALFALPPAEAARLDLPDLVTRIAPGLEEGARDPAGWTDALDGTPRLDRLATAPPRRLILERVTVPVSRSGPGGEGWVITFRDVTHRAQEEAAARRVVDEALVTREDLRRLHDEVRLANEGLERRLTELGRCHEDLASQADMRARLLANVSHELATPLVSIKGFTEMILGGRLGTISHEQREGLELAMRNINRLIGLIDGLLAAARGEPTLEIRLEEFDLDPVVEEAAALVRQDAEPRGITILKRLDPSLRCRADRDRILQVMLNLLSNAVKYNRQDGEVMVQAARTARGVRVSVRDTGIGMSPEQKEAIFGRFYRTDQARRAAGGTGIGLSIVQEILRHHGAVIRVESTEGKGSTFTFTLPAPAQGEEDP